MTGQTFISKAMAREGLAAFESFPQQKQAKVEPMWSRRTHTHTRRLKTSTWRIYLNFPPGQILDEKKVGRPSRKNEPIGLFRIKWTEKGSNRRDLNTNSMRNSTSSFS